MSVITRKRARAGVFAAAVAATLYAGTAAYAATYVVSGTDGAGLNARSAPNTGASVVNHYAEGAALSITCQTNGTDVNGASWVWDRLSNGSYVSDFYTNTPTVDNFSVGLPNCAGTVSPLNPNNYPWRVGPNDWVADGYGYYEGECVSFAAWAVRSDGLHHISSSSSLGNADMWHAAVVDNGPHVGDIAQWFDNVNGAGQSGHVAYVSEVYGDGTIQVEEYNWTAPMNNYTLHMYDTRRISASAPSRYLQF